MPGLLSNDRQLHFFLKRGSTDGTQAVNKRKKPKSILMILRFI
jgi:hypothetical protein